ncbi:hypothetical protein CCDG5_1430 [[Clostridium] cellulosi]|uniref:ABC transporter domain-containing protein n=1 Tax=[Clostridium] cellulosi TaxID=29343 RepID=A0A078KTU1_9FIRM|nr:hypothetical protein CCDG5_1430 [[Clostridium] cellulosi]
MLLQIKDLNITHLKDLREILNGFSFTLNPGDKAVIIGEEGNGKSTLLKLIYDPKLVEDYAEYTGEIIRGGSMGYLAQELTQFQKQMTVYEFCSAWPAFFNLTPRALGGHRVGTWNKGRYVLFRPESWFPFRRRKGEITACVHFNGAPGHALTR